MHLNALLRWFEPPSGKRASILSRWAEFDKNYTPQCPFCVGQFFGESLWLVKPWINFIRVQFIFIWYKAHRFNFNQAITI